MNAERKDGIVARMKVPSPHGYFGVVFIAVFLSFFTALSIYYLIDYSDTPVYGLIAAVLWLGFVGVLFFATFHEISVRECVVATLGEFSLCHFVEVTREGERTVIGFGFQLFFRRWYYLRVDREHIVSVDMSSGQGTALAGRDMNDWHVALWYRDPNAPPRKPIAGIRFDEEVYIVGPSNAKTTTEEFFQPFVAFLQSAGVALQPSEKENEFRTSKFGSTGGDDVHRQASADAPRTG
jgi:hypothetical protein